MDRKRVWISASVLAGAVAVACFVVLAGRERAVGGAPASDRVSDMPVQPHGSQEPFTEHGRPEPRQAPGRPLTPKESALKSRASDIHARLTGGRLKITCTPGVQEDLLSLLRDAEGFENLWSWTFEQTLACHGALGHSDAVSMMLQQALARHGRNPRVLELLARQNLLVGKPERAIAPARDALAIRESYDGWAHLGEAQLSMAGTASDPAMAAKLFQNAYDSASRAHALAPESMQPFQLLKMAQAQMGLRNTLQALELAAQAERSMSGVDARSQAALMPGFYMGLGSVYYQAGHRDIGLAYMDQAIAMVTGEKAAELERFKNAVIGSV